MCRQGQEPAASESDSEPSSSSFVCAGGGGANRTCLRSREPRDQRARLKLRFERRPYKTACLHQLLAPLRDEQPGRAESVQVRLRFHGDSGKGLWKCPAWESSILHSLEQLLKLMTHCQARRAIRCNKQAVGYLQRRRRSFMASGGVQVMRAHGSQGVSELIVLSLPQDPLFVSVNSPAHFFFYII